MSFTDVKGRRQSGCERVLRDMLDRSQLDANWNIHDRMGNPRER